MNAKYNWIIDNSGVRIALNVAGFGAWLSLVIALLKF